MGNDFVIVVKEGFFIRELYYITSILVYKLFTGSIEVVDILGTILLINMQIICIFSYFLYNRSVSEELKWIQY